MILVYNEGDRPVQVGDDVNVHELGKGSVSDIHPTHCQVYVTIPGSVQNVSIHPRYIGARWIEGDAEPTLDELFARLQQAQAVYYAALHKEMKKWPA